MSTVQIPTNTIDQAATKTYTSNDYTANTADAASYTGSGYTAKTGSASTYDPTKWSVDSNQTVAGQIKGMIDSNSPLMKQAETRALQEMNKRGMVNSSMAVGAGQAALYDAALPIAQQDANTYAGAAKFGAEATNASDQYNAGNAQAMTLANNDAQNRAAEYGATATNTSNQYNASNTQQANLANADAQNRAAEFSATASNTANQFNAQQENAQNQFNASETNDVLATTLDNNNKLALADIEKEYKTLMQTNQSVSDMYQMTIKSIESIQTDPDLTAETKATYISNQMTYLKTFMSLTEKMNNLTGLDELIAG